MTYGKSMRGHHLSSSTPGGQKESGKHRSSLDQSPLLENAHQEESPRTAHGCISIKPPSADTTVHESLSSRARPETYTYTQSKRRKCVSEEKEELAYEHASRDSMTRESMANTEEIPLGSDRPETSTTKAMFQRRKGQGRPRGQLSLSKNHDERVPSTCEVTTTPFAARRTYQVLTDSRPREQLDIFHIPQTCPMSLAPTCCLKPDFLDNPSSHSSSDTVVAPDNTASNRRRLVDILAASEQSAKESSPVATTENQMAPSCPSFSSSIRGNASARVSPAKNSGAETYNAESGQESTFLTPSHPRSSTITYARQRSFLSDVSISSDIGGQAAPASSVENYRPGQSQTTTKSSSISLHIHDDDYNATGSVRSIHELRQAGEKCRFMASVDSIFEDIEDNSASGRCNGFVQLCTKLLDPRFVHCFAECGFDKRLLECLTDKLDNLSATFALCAYELICSCRPLPSTLLVPFWLKILDLSPRLLEVEGDISLLATKQCYGLSKAGQESVQDIFAQLCSALSKDQPIHISPRLLALRCIQSTISTFRQSGDELDNIPLPLLTQLVDLLILESPTEIENCPFSSERFQILTLIFSILEAYTLLSGSLTSDCPNALRSVSRLHSLLSLKGCHDDRSRQIPILYMRVILNITNSNPSLSKDFATPQLVKGLVKTVAAEFCRVSETSTVKQNNSLDTVILALGTLINMTEENEASRLIFLKLEYNSESFFRILLHLFTSTISTTSEVN